MAAEPQTAAPPNPLEPAGPAPRAREAPPAAPAPPVPAVFRFRYRTSLLSLIAVMLAVNTSVAITLMREQGGPEMALAALFLIIPLVLGGSLISHARSRLVIDEAGVRRVWAGVTLQRIGWREIALVRVFGRPGLYRGRYFHILSTARRLPLITRRRIWFDENCVDLDGLLAALNFYLARHDIRVDNSYGAYKTDSRQI